MDEATPILEHPQARALLEEVVVTPQAVLGCQCRLVRFLERYLPLFYRQEQRENARIVIEGLLSGLKRKTCEPIAREHGVHRKPIQVFVGAGAWKDEAVMAELRRHVVEELGDEGAVLIIDPSSFPKKGTESCGVQRQWCGRLGKVENCQMGVCICYASEQGYAPLDRRLYLPKQWAEDREHRKKCHVPPAVRFQERWRIGLKMIDRCRAEGIPHGWVAGDDELGRPSEFRKALRSRKERYVLDVPGNTRVRDLQARPPRRRNRRGRTPKTPFVQARQWVARQPASAWVKVRLRPGSKGPLEVEALTHRVQTRDIKNRVGPEERLLAIRRTEGGETKVDYSLSNAPPGVPVEELARVHARRHDIEQMFQEAKGQAGLGHYEVRSWVGWHHHMTLAMLALWFLLTEKRRIGKKKLPGDHCASGGGDLFVPVAQSAADPVADSGESQ